MCIGQRIVGGFTSMLCLGILLGAMIMPLEARNTVVQRINGKSFSSTSVQPRVPQAGRPHSSSSMFIDRSTPISERPFANPFIDRSPPMSERPLAPLGGGTQVAPGRTPLVWCQGQWVRPDNPWQSCAPR
jgi:hypothetical protein